jgi:glutaminyl-peptide cyclotransferase
MKHQAKFVIFILSIAPIFISCNNEQSPKQTTKQQEPIKPYQRISPEFNADSAYFFVEKQVDFGSRVTNTEGHKKCGDWLVATLNRLANNVIEQKTQVIHYDGRKLNVRNIIAEFNPKASTRIILAAHWDTRDIADEDITDRDKPILGANDGGSGVGVLLEIARILAENPIDIGVDIILFDAEDLGKSNEENSFCIGSQFWSANPHKPGYKAAYGILLDMVGAPNAKFAWEQTSVYYAENILQKVWQTAASLGFSNYFVPYKKSGIIDDHYYVNKIAGIPMIDIIQFDHASRTGFPEHWHTHRDNMNTIDRNTLKAVGQTVLEVIFVEDKITQ